MHSESYIDSNNTFDGALIPATAAAAAAVGSAEAPVVPPRRPSLPPYSSVGSVASSQAQASSINATDMMSDAEVDALLEASVLDDKAGRLQSAAVRAYVR